MRGDSLALRYHTCMMRTRIQITEEPVQAIEDSAPTVERLVNEPTPGSDFECAARCSVPDVHGSAGRVRGLEGRFRSGNSNLAEAHDQYLDDAFDR